MPEFKISELGTPNARRYFAACESPIPLSDQAVYHLSPGCLCAWGSFRDGSVGITRRHPDCTTHPTPPKEETRG